MRPDYALPLTFVLLLMLATMGGTLWFLLPTQTNMDQARRAQTPVAEPAHGVTADPSARWRVQLAGTDRELQSLRQTKKRMDTELDRLTANAGLEPSPSPAAERDAHQLAALLARRKAQLERLRLVAGVERVAVDAPVRTGARPAGSGKEPVWFQLYAGRVLPVDERYYSVRTIDADGVAFRVLRRTSVGETFADATAAGSKFELALSNIVPQKQYIRCLVSQDSFPLLRSLMRLAAEKDIGLEWDPFQDQDGRIVFTPPRAGAAAMPR